MHLAILSGNYQCAVFLDDLHPSLKTSHSHFSCTWGARNPIFSASPLELASAQMQFKKDPVQTEAQNPGFSQWLKNYADLVGVTLIETDDAALTDTLCKILFNDQKTGYFCRLSTLEAAQTAFLPQVMKSFLLPHHFSLRKANLSFEELVEAAYDNVKLHSALITYCASLDPILKELALEKYDAEVILFVNHEDERQCQLPLAIHRQHPLADSLVYDDKTGKTMDHVKSGRPFRGKCRVIIEGHGSSRKIASLNGHKFCQMLLISMRVNYGVHLPENMVFILNSCSTAEERREGENFFTMFASELAKQKINAEVRASNGYVWSGFGEDGSALGLCFVGRGSNKTGWDVESWQGPDACLRMAGQEKIKGITEFNRVYDLVWKITVYNGQISQSVLRSQNLDDSEGLYSLRPLR